MTGTIINAVLIIFAVLFGVLTKLTFPIKIQQFLRTLIAAYTFFIGIKLILQSFDPGFIVGIKSTLTAILSLIIGNVIGKLLRIQNLSNELGNFANKTLEKNLSVLQSGYSAPDRCNFSDVPANKNISTKMIDKIDVYEKQKLNWNTKLVSTFVILFCLNPIGIVGAVYEGTRNSPDILLVKSVIDCLLSFSLYRYFKFQILTAIFPMVLWQIAITLIFTELVELPIWGKSLPTSFYDPLVGLFCFIFILPILEIRKVEFGNYLPSLLILPVLATMFI